MDWIIGLWATDDAELMLVPYTYSTSLVLLSLLIAILGSSLALYLARSLASFKDSRARFWWRLAGAVAFGGAVWSMHFVGMLAVSLCISVSYSPWITLSSVLPALIAAWWAIDTIALRHRTWRQGMFAAVIVGGGIGVMHYSGMAAMQMTANLRFAPIKFATAVVAAVTLAWIALFAMDCLAQRLPRTARSRNIEIAVGGTGFGVAITTMHYLGMASARFVGPSEYATPQPAEDYLYLTALILLGALGMLGSVAAGVLLTRLRTEYDLMSRIRGDYQSLIDGLSKGVFTIDRLHRVSAMNRIGETFVNEAETPFDLILTAIDTSDEPLHLAEFMVSDDEHGPQFLQVSSVPRQDPQTGEQGNWLMITDITHLKRREQRYFQSEKLATLGEMVTGVAHEMNQPLNAIRLSLANLKRLLSRDAIDFDRIRTKIDSLDTSVDRIASLVWNMRTYGRAPVGSFSPFDLRVSLQRAFSFWQTQLAAVGIELSLDLTSEDPCWVMGSEEQFDQVLLNLITNARDAVGDQRKGGRITLTLDAEADTYRLTVTDTGPGMEPDVLARIFDPFFTTKPPGEGTGLGAAVSHGIVKDMHGRLTAESTASGARLSIVLPAHHLDAESNNPDRNSRALS